MIQIQSITTVIGSSRSQKKEFLSLIFVLKQVYQMVHCKKLQLPDTREIQETVYLCNS